MALAVAVGAAFAVWGSDIALGRAETGDVASGVLSYAAIAFGFSIAGLTIAMTAPGDAFARELAWSDPNTAGVAKTAPKRNSYGNLLFVFSWTALAHWVVIVGAFLALAGLGKSSPLLGDGASSLHRVASGLFVGFTVYAVALFLVTLVTLADVGAVYIKRLQRTPPD